MKTYLTSESVCQGHPDKLCDYIADSILDACLSLDPASRVACEVMATEGLIIVAGEVTCGEDINVRRVVRKALMDCGYKSEDYRISVLLHNQSPDIDSGVTVALEVRQADDGQTELGAGDQGTVYGYATDETESAIPLSLELSHRICKGLDACRRDGTIKGIHSDGKAQVTVEYQGGVPVRIETIVVSVQHDADKDHEALRAEIIREVLLPSFEDFPFDGDTHIFINPSGRFVVGGPAADTGLTGRKMMVDTYGGLALHGGGAFSGKDATKVDRSAAYMARLIAKTIVASSLAARCEIAISYAIGKADPVAINVDTFGTGRVGDAKLARAVQRVFPLRPRAIIEHLGLRTPLYKRTSCYGHFGRSEFSWEHVSQDHIEALLEEVGHDH